MCVIRNVLSAAQTALYFSYAVSHELRPIIDLMIDQDASQRLVSLLVVLSLLSQDAKAEKIPAVTTSDAPLQIIEDTRMLRILDYIQVHYISAE